MDVAAQPLPLHVAKPEALARLARVAGLTRLDASDGIAGLIARLPRLSNVQIGAAASADVPGVVLRTRMLEVHRPVGPPEYTNGRPPWFPERTGFERSPPFEVLEIAGGAVLSIARSPVVMAGDGTTVISDFSSPFAGLLHGYDIDAVRALASGRRIRGTAVVLCDDIDPVNYGHWLLDELPRLAFLGGRRDVTVIATEDNPAFKRDSLDLCGFAASQIVNLRDFSAVRADRLLVPADIIDMPHPAFKAAPWVFDFLRGRLGFASLASLPVAETPRKLFVSRDDSLGRRVINEQELMQHLAPRGYQRITLAGLPIAQQVALFARASHVVAAHGAGLANLVFAPRTAQLLELFPHTFGTAAYSVLAAGQGQAYATYLSRDVTRGAAPQLDDFRIDTTDFLRCCGHLL